MKRANLRAWTALAVLIPGTLYLGSRLPGRWYYLTGTLMLLEMMAPFFLAFERRRPQARELTLLAVLCALAVASRVVVPLPNFKPTSAFIMLAGISLGPEGGFLVGAITALASNFFFSQGPWTPWQMASYGVAGWLAGLVFHRRLPERAWVLPVFGFLEVLLITGPLLDLCSLFTISTELTARYALAVFASGFAFNVQHAAATATTLLLFGRPLLTKLERIQQKYGLLDSRLSEN